MCVEDDRALRSFSAPIRYRFANSGRIVVYPEVIAIFLGFLLNRRV